MGISKPILIIGGGPAGRAAARALADFGQKSVLVEKEGRLGVLQSSPGIRNSCQPVSGQKTLSAVWCSVEASDFVDVRTNQQ